MSTFFYTHKKTLLLAITGAVLLIPLLADAATLRTFKDFAAFIIYIANTLVIILATLALIVFLWGVTKTLFHSDSEEVRETGKKTMLYGVISLFVMVSLWGLIFLLQNTFFGGGGLLFGFPAATTQSVEKKDYCGRYGGYGCD